MANTSTGFLACKIANGDDCEGFLFDTEFVQALSTTAPPPGKVIRISVDDPSSLGSDVRTVVLLADNDPGRVVGFGKIEEGGSATFTMNRSASTVDVWMDSSRKVVLDVFDSKSAADQTTAEENRSATEKVITGVVDELKEQQKTAAARADRILLGVGVILVVAIIAFAVIAPSIKIPTLKVS